MPEAEHQKSAQNYELLIRLDEKFVGFSREMRETVQNMTKGLGLLDTTKYSKEDAAKEFAELVKITDDHEKRIRTTEESVSEMRTQIKTWAKIGVSIVTVLNIIQFVIAISK